MMGGSFTGEWAALRINPKEFYVSNEKAYDMEIGKEIGVGESRCTYGVQLTV